MKLYGRLCPQESAEGLRFHFAQSEKFALINEHWRPKVVASLNGQEVKLVKFSGTFPWHLHANEDELFLVWRGSMSVEFRDRIAICSTNRQPAQSGVCWLAALGLLTCEASICFNRK